MRLWASSENTFEIRRKDGTWRSIDVFEDRIVDSFTGEELSLEEFVREMGGKLEY